MQRKTRLFVNETTRNAGTEAYSCEQWIGMLSLPPVINGLGMDNNEGTIFRKLSILETDFVSGF
jgi:hypothetical protein